ncbi:MAG: hypothetical protein KAJ11_17380 [Alphaproteobacteria bacterium]|nr:hypothetical protein [Alphaproteobacteria bacterium]MCK5624077.1 hypothetical protein [Alphaproteobacteria bacterium]
MANDRETAEANLALLIREANMASTGQEKQQARGALEHFTENTLFPNLGTVAEAAIAITAAQTRQAAINRMRAQLDEINDLREAFKTAERVAADGEENMFFPRVASSLAQVETLLGSLKEQFDAVRNNIGELKNGVDLDKLKDLASSVETAAEKLKGELDGL